jgi:hypothetical protein
MDILWVIDIAGVFTVHGCIFLSGFLNYVIGLSVTTRGITLLVFSRCPAIGSVNFATR